MAAAAITIAAAQASKKAFMTGLRGQLVTLVKIIQDVLLRTNLLQTVELVARLTKIELAPLLDPIQTNDLTLAAR